MITKKMFIISQVSEELQERFRNVAIDCLHLDRNNLQDLMVAAVSSTPAASAEGVIVFTHTYDPELATSHLRECFRYTADEIRAMAPQAQAQVVEESWRAFGRYWQAMNLRPYGCAALRKVFAKAWGGPPWGDQNEAAMRAVAVDQSTFINWTWPGQWRANASSRFASAGNPTRDPHTVIFGSQDDNDGSDIDNAFGCSSANTQANDDCPMPAELHRLWLQNNGRVNAPFVHTPDQCRAAGGVLDDTGMDFVDQPFGDEPDNPRFWAWEFGAWEDSTPLVGRDRLYYLPPLELYWKLLHEPFPGLKVTPDGPDVSLASWLYLMGPAQVARTVQRDVVLKNILMLQVRGRKSLAELSAISGDVEQADLREHQQDLEQVEAIGSMLLTGAAALAVKFPVGTVAAVILGAAGLVAAFAPELFVTEVRHIDLFGRLMAAVEIFAQVSGPGAVGYLESLLPPAPVVIVGWSDERAPEGTARPVQPGDRRLPGPAPVEPDSAAPPPVADDSTATPGVTVAVVNEDRQFVAASIRPVSVRGKAAFALLGILSALATFALTRRKKPEPPPQLGPQTRG